MLLVRVFFLALHNSGGPLPERREVTQLSERVSPDPEAAHVNDTTVPILGSFHTSAQPPPSPMNTFPMHIPLRPAVPSFLFLPDSSPFFLGSHWGESKCSSVPLSRVASSLPTGSHVAMMCHMAMGSSPQGISQSHAIGRNHGNNGIQCSCSAANWG